MFESEKKIIENALVAARKNGTPENLKTLRDAREALGKAIAAGAVPCKVCGNEPHGIVQPRGIGKEIFEFVEIGCLHCKDGHGVIKQTREMAVVEWNKQNKKKE